MKIMKRVINILVAMTVGLMGFCTCACASEEANPPGKAVETPADATKWVETLLGDNPQVLEDAWLMTSQMKLAIALSGGMAKTAESLSSLGTIEKIGSAYEGELKGYKVFYVPCVFSAMSIDLIVVTDNGAVAGLQTGPYTGDKDEAAESDLFDSIELSLPVPSLQGELPGTLTVPKGEGPFPAVVLIQGSGPSDRDETMMNAKPFRDIAEGLAEKGIAVYRFDKRTYVYGVELMDDHQATLVDESIADAVAAVQLLATQDKIDPSRIFVLGHSLGGNAIPAIDQALQDQPVSACGYILMAASTRPLDQLMREQYDYLYSLMPEITSEQQAEKDALFAELDKLENLDSLTENDMIAGAYAPYWKWLAEYDVLKTAQEITKPCLLLQGEEDYQVTVEDFEIWKDAFGEKENWQLVLYPGLIHIFTTGQKSEGAAAYAHAEKVDAQVIEDIAAFVNQTEAK
ncbi:MAG: alpha/beta fold hydrolase [Coriobacteriales bacterium]|nr:alpha/beta fold hydrolase [Coriobacteriales bacterium]